MQFQRLVQELHLQGERPKTGFFTAAIERQGRFLEVAMLTKIFFTVVNRSPRGRRTLFRWLFEALSRKYNDLEEWTQMNYGFAALAGSGHTLFLDKRDETERYCRQLYAHVASGPELNGCDVVEVSSGRGGGAAFLCSHLGLGTMTGVDIAHSAVAFCRKTHKAGNLRFLQGDAEDLPLFDESADAIINIEASFCYGDFRRFLSEAFRIIRPGGHLLYADLRHAEEIVHLREMLMDSGFSIVEEEDISENVVRALALDSERRQNPNVDAPALLRDAVQTFTGAPGTRIPTLLAGKKMRYLKFRLQKPMAPSQDIENGTGFAAHFGVRGHNAKGRMQIQEALPKVRKLEDAL